MNKIKNFSTVVSLNYICFLKNGYIFIHFLINVILPLHPKTVLGDGEITVKERPGHSFMILKRRTISSMDSFNLCCSK